MNVYVDNILTKAQPLTVTNIDGVYTADMLYDEALSNNIEFTTAGTVITASWGLNHHADAIAILESNWTIGRLVIVSQSTTIFDKAITSQGKHTIIKLPNLYMVSQIRLELNTQNEREKLKVGILFVGRRIELPLFNVGFKYRLNVNSKPERTRYGIVYGSKKTSLRSFDITFTDINNSRRMVMEDYIDAVQYVQPHLIEPYESPEYPPIYATLTDAGGFDKTDSAEFCWNSALSYMEAK